MSTTTLSRRTDLAAANRRPTGGVLASLGVLAGATAAGAAVL